MQRRQLTVLGAAVVVLLVAAISALVLERFANEAAPPARAAVLPLLDAVPDAPTAAGAGPPPSPGVLAGGLPAAVGAATAPPPPTTAPPRQDNKPPPKRAAQPSAVARCGQYDRGGSVHPLCSGGGGPANVVVQRITGTNVTVNRAWAANVSAFFGAARAAGYELGAWDVAGPGYGSYRTTAMQRDLRRRGFPANPPGESMHEWGLAIDLSCNGVKFLDASPPCRDWVRANARDFGIYNLPSEPWHWSSNGR